MLAALKRSRHDIWLAGWAVITVVATLGWFWLLAQLTWTCLLWFFS